MSKVKDRTGEKYGSLVVLSQGPSIPKAPGSRSTYVMWNCECVCGNATIVRGGNLHAGGVQSCGGPAHPRGKQGQAVSYVAAHRRTKKIRGSASAHKCAHPECTRKASEWAYDGLDRNELVTPGGTTYSTDPWHYQPYCASHHRKFDLRRINAARF